MIANQHMNDMLWSLEISAKIRRDHPGQPLTAAQVDAWEKVINELSVAQVADFEESAGRVIHAAQIAKENNLDFPRLQSYAVDIQGDLDRFTAENAAISRGSF